MTDWGGRGTSASKCLYMHTLSLMLHVATRSSTSPQLTVAPRTRPTPVSTNFVGSRLNICIFICVCICWAHDWHIFVTLLVPAFSLPHFWHTFGTLCENIETKLLAHFWHTLIILGPPRFQGAWDVISLVVGEVDRLALAMA